MTFSLPKTPAALINQYSTSYRHLVLSANRVPQEQNVQCVSGLSAYEEKFFIILFGRALKLMENGVHFSVKALLFAELFKILIYAN